MLKMYIKKNGLIKKNYNPEKVKPLKLKVSTHINKTEFNYIPFSKIVYINLRDRIDRKKKFEKFYENQDFEPERYAAKRTNLDNFSYDHPELTISEYVKNSSNERWVNGTLGCYDSHYSILKENEHHNNCMFLVILEDDCIISKEDLNKCLEFLHKNPNIDILRINCWLDIPTNPFKIDTINRHSRYYDGNSTKYFDGGTHCCIYHTKKIPHIINFLQKENVFQIDAVFSNKIINSVVYKIPKNIKYQSKSSIQGNVQKPSFLEMLRKNRK
jgi:GR25 family glycosyltransferase involved in LPS biosynthesis